MPELTVVIVATDNEQRTVLQVLVDGTSVASTVHTCATFPMAASDPIMRASGNADNSPQASFPLVRSITTPRYFSWMG